MLRHGGSDLRRLEHLREERLIHQHALQDAEQQVVEEWAKVRKLNDQIASLLGDTGPAIPRQEAQPRDN